MRWRRKNESFHHQRRKGPILRVVQAVIHLTGEMHDMLDRCVNLRLLAQRTAMGRRREMSTKAGTGMSILLAVVWSSGTQSYHVLP